MRKRQTETVKIEDVPKMGFLRAREMEALFNHSITTLKRWVKRGILPEPVNQRKDLVDMFGPTSDLFWSAEEAWAAYDKLQRSAT